MNKMGFYLTTLEPWGIHKPKTLLAQLSIRSILSDFIIDKARKIAAELGIDSFGIMYVNIFGASDMIYTPTPKYIPK